MSPEEFLKAIASGMPGRGHLMRPEGIIVLAWWKSVGEPCLWKKVESSHGYTAWEDSGYGHLALTTPNQLIGWGRDSVVSPHCVCLDKNYWNVSKYLWF